MTWKNSVERDVDVEKDDFLDNVDAEDDVYVKKSDVEYDVEDYVKNGFEVERNGPRWWF